MNKSLSSNILELKGGKTSHSLVNRGKNWSKNGHLAPAKCVPKGDQFFRGFHSKWLKEEVRRRQNKEVIYKGKLHGFVLKLTSDRNCFGNISAMYQPNLNFIGAK